jgi:mRNA interferase RelE/StbE
MKADFKKSFLKELRKIKNKKLQSSILDCILQVEQAANLSQIKNLKKLSGYDVYYRIKVGDYRIGIKIEGTLVYFVTFDHRKDIYKGFP